MSLSSAIPITPFLQSHPDAVALAAQIPVWAVPPALTAVVQEHLRHDATSTQLASGSLPGRAGRVQRWPVSSTTWSNLQRSAAFPIAIPYLPPHRGRRQHALARNVCTVLAF